jgi:hypothetical protein
MTQPRAADDFAVIRALLKRCGVRPSCYPRGLRHGHFRRGHITPKVGRDRSLIRSVCHGRCARIPYPIVWLDWAGRMILISGTGDRWRKNAPR